MRIGCGREQFRSWKLADYSRFPDFARYLAANDATYHLGNSESQINATYFELVNKLRTQPIVFSGITINDTMFRELTFSVLYNDADFSLGGQIWQAADGQAVAVTNSLKNAVESLQTNAQTALAAVPEDNGAASALAVVCNDVQWSRAPSQYLQELTADKLLFPKFGELGSNIWPCAYWHYPPQEALTAVNPIGVPSILMIQNERDPATPYIGALETRALLGNRARMVSVDQGGHAAAYLAANQCATNAVNQYFATGTLPAHDTRCAAETTPTFAPQSPAQQRAIEKLRQLVQR